MGNITYSLHTTRKLLHIHITTHFGELWVYENERQKKNSITFKKVFVIFVTYLLKNFPQCTNWKIREGTVGQFC